MPAMPAMAFILLSWLLIAAALAGLGLGLHRLLGQREPSAALLLSAAPTGLAAALLFLQLWHFFLPVTALAFLVLLVPALAGVFAFARDLRWVTYFRDRGGPAAVVAITLTLACLWLANRALGPGEAFDSGLYHWNAIRWNNTFAVVPGLGNLHHRLAFNNGSLLLAAMLNTGPWEQMAGHLLPGLMLLLLLQRSLPGVVALALRRASPTTPGAPAHAASAMLLAPALLAAMSFDLAAPTTDLPVGVMVLLGCAALSAALPTTKEDSDRAVHLVTASLALAAGACMKLSALPLALAAVPILLALARPLASRHRRAMWGATAIAATLLLTWAARGVVLSGYPCFPSTFLAAPVSWRVPAPTADAIRAGITQFARQQFAESGPAWNQWDWVGPMFNRLPWATTLYGLESGAALLAIAWVLARRRDTTSPHAHPHVGRVAWIALPLLAGLATWFLSAPDPRFAWHLFWIAPVAAGAAVALTPRPRLLLTLWALPLLLAAATSFADWGPRLWQSPGHDYRLSPIPTPGGIVRQTIPPGAAIDVASDGLIWNHPVPSTSLVEPGARARDANDWGKGFVPDEAAGRGH